MRKKRETWTYDASHTMTLWPQDIKPRLAKAEPMGWEDWGILALVVMAMWCVIAAVCQ